MPANLKMTSSSPELAVVDTSIYISLLRQGKYEKALIELPYLVRLSSVVMAELLRGAHSRKAIRAVEGLCRGHTLVTPSENQWIESGQTLAELAQNKHYDSNKLGELHFDVLIALSARGIGAYVITANADDFLAIKRVKLFKLIIWS